MCSDYESTYAYDQTTPTTTSGIPQHVGVPSARGNLTTVSPWLNTTNATSGATTIAYYDTGAPVSSLGPTGTTSYGFDGTQSFLTGLTPPTPSSGVSLPSSATYDPNSGMPLTSVDPNSQTVTYKSYDPLLRPTEIDYPDGGKMVASYTANQTGVYHYMTASTHSNTQTNLDGYGRLNWVAVQNASGYYWNSYCYDGNGNMQFAAYRSASGTSACSGAGGDSYTHDALGRVLTITHGDSSTVTYSYNGRATQATDENGVSRITQLDGHGRITTVCEISSSTLQGVAPVSCGTDISGQTGFLTTYAYTTDSSGDQVTTVTQGGQTRVTKTDSLDRSVSVTEPERGTTTYSYAYRRQTKK